MIDFVNCKKYILSLKNRVDRRERFFDQKLPYEFEIFEAIPAKEILYYGRLKKGQVACKTSHELIIRDAIKNKCPYIVIFEDDAEFCEDFSVKIDIIKNVPSDWNMLYLGAHHYMKPLPVSDGIGRCVTSLSTVAYMINSNMYQVLLKELKRDMILDVIYTNIIQQSYNCYCLFPNLVVQSEGKSDIENMVVNYDKFYNKWL